MSFKRSVFYRVGRPAEKPVPLNVIARIGSTHVVPEEKSKEETTKSDSQTDLNKLTQAITDAISNAVKQNKPPMDPEGPPGDGQQNNNTGSTNNNAGLEDLEKLVVNDDKGVVEPLSPSYDESISSGGDALKELDLELYEAIQKSDKRGATFIREDRKGGKNEQPLKGRVVVLKKPVTDDSITYVVHSTTSRPNGGEMKDFTNFKNLLLHRNKAVLNGGDTTNKSVIGFVNKHP